MSAYICDPEHIKALAIYASQRQARYGRNVEPFYVFARDYGTALAAKPDNDIATTYADTLYQENIRSVQARYPDDKWDELPGPCEKPEHLTVSAREYYYDRRLSPVAILKMCDGLEYQSCETSNYRDTIGFKLLDLIRGAAIHALPGYEEAPWEYTGPESLTEAKEDKEAADDWQATYRMFAD